MTRPIHFEILADDPESVGAFYAAVMDWEVSTWGGGEYWLVKTGKEGTPGFDGGIMRREFAQAVINTMEVESLQESLAKVEAAGGKLITGPNEVPGVGMHAYCSDPEGNMFGLMETFEG